jgi:hypothetical protein
VRAFPDAAPRPRRDAEGVVDPRRWILATQVLEQATGSGDGVRRPRDVRPIASIDLYWLPLGAGGRSVGLNGRIFEWVASWLAGRDRRDLYHSALDVRVSEERFVIEQAPAWSERLDRGVVAEGAVGARAAGRLRLFRYEVRRWRDGAIPDVSEAVESPRRLSDDPACARRLLDLVPQVPTPLWGRDQLHAGEMWNSNSTISWLLCRSGLDVASIRPPAGGRAPGWRAGIVVARRTSADYAARSRRNT